MKSSVARRQQGMALLIALVVLVVVSILGATAMRSAAFQSRVSVNAQATQLLFHGAESGLESAFRYAANQVEGGTLPTEAGHVFREALVTGPQRICVDENGDLLPADTDVTIDTAKTTKYKVAFNFTECDPREDNPVVITTLVSRPPCDLARPVQPPGFSIGGPGTYQMVQTRSFASIDGMGAEKSHIQLWGIMAVTGEGGVSGCSI